MTTYLRKCYKCLEFCSHTFVKENLEQGNAQFCKPFHIKLVSLRTSNLSFVQCSVMWCAVCVMNDVLIWLNKYEFRKLQKINSSSLIIFLINNPSTNSEKASQKLLKLHRTFEKFCHSTKYFAITCDDVKITNRTSSNFV